MLVVWVKVDEIIHRKNQVTAEVSHSLIIDKHSNLGENFMKPTYAKAHYNVIDGRKVRRSY